jgi:hypothetical protein
VNLGGVDVAWVEERLNEYITETRPVDKSGPNVFTARRTPNCVRPRAIELTETVVPIFTRLYPQWRSENQPIRIFEFQAERDAANKLLARLKSNETVTARLGGGDMSPRLTAASLHHLIWRAA